MKSLSFLLLVILLLTSCLDIEAQNWRPSGRIRGKKAPPGQCNQENDSNCCVRWRRDVHSKCCVRCGSWQLGWVGYILHGQTLKFHIDACIMKACIMFFMCLFNSINIYIYIYKVFFSCWTNIIFRDCIGENIITVKDKKRFSDLLPPKNLKTNRLSSKPNTLVWISWDNSIVVCYNCIQNFLLWLIFWI
jgi:hypothetical protein